MLVNSVTTSSFGRTSCFLKKSFNTKLFNADQFNSDQFNSDLFNSDQFNSDQFEFKLKLTKKKTTKINYHFKLYSTYIGHFMKQNFECSRPAC